MIGIVPTQFADLLAKTKDLGVKAEEASHIVTQHVDQTPADSVDRFKIKAAGPAGLVKKRLLLTWLGNLV